MKKRFLTVLVIIFSLSSNAQQLNNVYVLSEGGFSTGTSVLSKLDLSNDEFTQNIFNPGDLGLFPDGLVHYGENLFLTEQGSFGGAGKIYKLKKDGSVINSREIGTNPYSLTISNEKIYITNAPAGSVSVINLNDFSDVKNIKVGAYPQEIISNENRVFVANNSLYGGPADSTVSVIDAAADEVITTIKGKRDPFAFSSISLAISNDEHLLFACPGSGVNAIIFKVDLVSFEKVDSFLIPGYGFDRDLYSDPNSDKLFFKSSTNEIVEYDLSIKTVIPVVTDEKLISINGYGYDYISNTHYVADAKDFAVNGSLSVYDSKGSFLNSYETSIVPRRITLEYGENTVSVEDEIISSEFRLEQNYPNPFNPSSTIKYTIPLEGKIKNLSAVRQDSKFKSTKEDGFIPSTSISLSQNSVEGWNVSLKVYSILGREIATLVNQKQKPGNYEVIFNGSDLASGMYFYKLKAGDYSSVKKMMLLK